MTLRPDPAAALPASGAPEGDEDGRLGLESPILRGVRVSLRASLGDVAMTVEELLALKAGAVLKLDRMLSEPVDLYLNESLVARGEVVAVDDSFALRIVEVAPP